MGKTTVLTGFSKLIRFIKALYTSNTDHKKFVLNKIHDETYNYI